MAKYFSIKFAGWLGYAGGSRLNGGKTTHRRRGRLSTRCWHLFIRGAIRNFKVGHKRRCNICLNRS